MGKEISIQMTLFDHLVLPPVEMLKLLRRKGLDTDLPIRAFPNGDKGVIYVGRGLT